MALKLLAVAFATCIGYAHSVRSTSSNSTYDLKAKAAMYVKSMEETALTKIDHYSEVPGMTSKEINAFLTHVYREVLEPELESHGYSRMVMATQATVVIGDLHGQLFNLLAFLRLLLLNSEALKEYEKLPESQLFICDSRFQYIFMGDYVDRGERSVEIVMLLLAYKALCPSGIILLQGNHEQAATNEYYGFSKEVEYKLDRVWKMANPQSYGRYGQHSMHSAQSPLWRQFNSVFSKLPFVAVLPGGFMATHGGISPTFVKACSNQRGNFRECLSPGIGAEMVWADPHEGSGWDASPRGAGAWRFGRDIALQFLYSNGLKRLLRGHEQMAKGISTIWLDTKSEYAVQTVFSAADYVGTFCVDKTTNRPLRLPAWEPQMFNGGGQRNHGGMMVVDHSAGSRMDFHPCILSGKEARKLAKTFTGAHCHHSVSASATRPMQRSPKTAPSTATTTTRRTSPTTTTTTGGNQGFLPDNSSPATTTTTTRPTAATATPSTTEAGATNTVETGGSAVEKTTTTEESETHPYSEGTTTAMESQENAHSEETVMEPAPAPAPAPDPALAASPTAAEHADSEETTTAMAAEEHADSEETTTTTTIDMSDMWYWPHDDSEDDTTTPELGWKDKFKSYFGLALLEERVNDPETEQVELPIHCRDRLSQNETQEHEDYVHSILVAAEDMQFEARKIIDLQGEAAVCDDPQQASSENCKAMARDVITLKVFMELKGSKQVVEDLQDNMVAREEEVEELVGNFS
mmetsp:Transcript_118563/g.281445  ORF Transcript_118563/g.281445 Transcript_118563/m.281445 type:complete len:749 (-) Transcript_118563:66-2312(-)